MVVNEAYETGQASSVRTGISALCEREDTAADCDATGNYDAALVALGDMPYVEPSTVEAILTAYARGVGDAIAPAYEGVRGNPVLFDKRFFEALADVDGDIGGREILLKNETSALVDVADRGIRRDVDQPDDIDRPSGADRPDDL
jgi:molybdenum cofactor cytidylyltransferase